MVRSSTATPSGLVRVPGRGGAALFLRAGWAPAGWQDLERTGLVLDVGLLDPLRHVQHLGRPCGVSTAAALAAFLLSAATEHYPETSLPDFQDAEMGLALSVVQSTVLEVELDVLVVRDLGEDLIDHDHLNFLTTRAVLVSAAQQVRSLDDVPPRRERSV